MGQPQPVHAPQPQNAYGVQQAPYMGQPQPVHAPQPQNAYGVQQAPYMGQPDRSREASVVSSIGQGTPAPEAFYRQGAVPDGLPRQTPFQPPVYGGGVRNPSAVPTPDDQANWHANRGLWPAGAASEKRTLAKECGDPVLSFGATMLYVHPNEGAHAFMHGARQWPDMNGAWFAPPGANIERDFARWAQPLQAHEKPLPLVPKGSKLLRLNDSNKDYAKQHLDAYFINTGSRQTTGFYGLPHKPLGVYLPYTNQPSNQRAPSHVPPAPYPGAGTYHQSGIGMVQAPVQMAPMAPGYAPQQMGMGYQPVQAPHIYGPAAPYPQNGVPYPQNGQQYAPNGAQYMPNGQQYAPNGAQYMPNAAQQDPRFALKTKVMPATGYHM
jgi:hypothetical protein